MRGTMQASSPTNFGQGHHNFIRQSWKKPYKCLLGFRGYSLFSPTLQFDPGQVSTLQAVDQNLGSGNVGGNGDGAGIA